MRNKHAGSHVNSLLRSQC